MVYITHLENLDMTIRLFFPSLSDSDRCVLSDPSCPFDDLNALH